MLPWHAQLSNDCTGLPMQSFVLYENMKGQQAEVHDNAVTKDSCRIVLRRFPIREKLQKIRIREMSFFCKRNIVVP